MFGAMRRSAILAGASMFALAGGAEAGFAFNYTVTPGTGDLAGKNVFNFYAKNDQKGEQYGSKSLLVMETHFKTQGAPFAFDFRDVDGDLQADANVFGKDFDESNGRSTFMRIGSYPDWISVQPAANTYSTKAGANPQQAYGNVSDFLVTGFSLNKALDATQGLGRFFGTAVVAEGVDIHVFGKVAAEVGGIAEPGAAAAKLAESDWTLAAMVQEWSGESVGAKGPVGAPSSPGARLFL